MKNILSVFILSLALVACSDDDDSGSTDINLENELNVGDAQYELKSGIIEDFGSYDGSLYNYDIQLYNTNFTMQNGNPIPEDNIVSGVYFELFSNSSENLGLGDYIKVDYYNIGDKTYEIADLYVDVNVEDQYSEPIEISSGTLQVLEVGSTYEFAFSGEDEWGNQISFYYKGELEQIDSTE